MLASAVVPAAASAAPAYQPGTYTFSIDKAYVVDIQGTVDPGETCAELYGYLAVKAGTKPQETYFQSDVRTPADVCERATPLNEGKQVGDLPRNGGWRQGGSTLVLKGKADDPAWKLDGNVWDVDTTSGNDKVCKGISEMLRPGGNEVTAGTWSCKGEDGAQVVVEWSIRRHSNMANDKKACMKWVINRFVKPYPFPGLSQLDAKRKCDKILNSKPNKKAVEAG